MKNYKDNCDGRVFIGIYLLLSTIIMFNFTSRLQKIVFHYHKLTLAIYSLETISFISCDSNSLSNSGSNQNYYH